MVVHLSSSRLDDEDIFATDRFLYLNAGLADGKLAQQSPRWRNAQVVANGLCELRMGAASQDNNIPDHDVKREYAFLIATARGGEGKGSKVGMARLDEGDL